MGIRHVHNRNVVPTIQGLFCILSQRCPYTIAANAGPQAGKAYNYIECSSYCGEDIQKQGTPDFYKKLDNAVPLLDRAYKKAVP